MNNFFKSNWIAITICLVFALATTGGAVFSINKSTQKHHAAAAKTAAELLEASASLEMAKMEVTKNKNALDKEKALNESLKKMVAETDSELEKLRNLLKTMTPATAKTSKPNAVNPSANVAPPDCRPTEPKFTQNKIRALQNLQLDIRKRDKELKEKQKK